VTREWTAIRVGKIAAKFATWYILCLCTSLWFVLQLHFANDVPRAGLEVVTRRTSRGAKKVVEFQ
jgi:hypothetical protein